MLKGISDAGLHLSLHSLEPVSQLFEEVLDHALVVVTPAQNVIQRRKAMRLTALLLMVELFSIKFVTSDDAPVVARRVHRKAGRQRAVNPDDH